MGTIRPQLLEAIDSTLARAQRVNVDAILASRYGKPGDIAPDYVLDQRRHFLADQMGGELSQSQLAEAFERILRGNELQDVNYLEKGAKAAQSVCLIRFGAGGGGSATGFLIAPGVLLTNNHVLPDPETARTAKIRFRYERDAHDRPRVPVTYGLRPDSLFFTSKSLDFTVVAVDERDVTGQVPLETFGFLVLNETTGKVAEGEWLTIVQHPAGQLKQVCVRENQLLRRFPDFVWYSTDTMSGSSGSPVFSNDWLVIALHHSGVPELRGGVKQTVLGRDFDPAIHGEDDIKWIANEGVRISRIVQTLREALPGHELIRPVILPWPAAPGGPTHARIPEAQMSRSVTVQLEIDDSGGVRMAGSGPAQAFEASTGRPSGYSDEHRNRIRSPADETFSKDHLAGYDPKLGSFSVLLPKIGASMQAHAAPLVKKPNETELKYEHFSVVMNKVRRLAFFSAATVSASRRHTLSGRENRWLNDRRILTEHQLDESFYKNSKFDIGHLTGREEMEYGDTIMNAVRSANGTFVLTNCAPQRDVFNQGDGGRGKEYKLWKGLEQFIFNYVKLEGQGDVSLKVFTGPIFSEWDPVFRGVKIPLEFWKVVVGVDVEDKLFATAYVLSQENLVVGVDLDKEAERPLGEYMNFQRAIAEIELDTGLQFCFKDAQGNEHSLTTVDPLAPEARAARAARAAGRRRTSGRISAAEAAYDDDGSGALHSFEDIVLG